MMRRGLSSGQGSDDEKKTEVGAMGGGAMESGSSAKRDGQWYVSVNAKMSRKIGEKVEMWYIRCSL